MIELNSGEKKGLINIQKITIKLQVACMQLKFFRYQGVPSVLMLDWFKTKKH